MRVLATPPTVLWRLPWRMCQPLHTNALFSTYIHGIGGPIAMSHDETLLPLEELVLNTTCWLTSPRERYTDTGTDETATSVAFKVMPDAWP